MKGMKKISLKEAKRRGLVRFFTGKPCRKGHIAERRVSNRLCVICAREHTKQRPRWAKLIYGALKRAKKKNMAYNLDWTWAKARWTGRCEVTGFVFETENIRWRASIDRIDSKKGYTKDNCRFVLNLLNSWKGAKRTDKDLVRLAYAIVEAHKRGNIS